VAHWVANDQPGPARARLDRLDPLEAARSPLDVLGEIIGTFHEARRSGLRLSPEVWSMERAQIDHLERIWANADAELLSGPSILDAGTYSKAMAWFALDRALRDIDEFGLPGPVKRWSRLRSEVHADVCRTGYNAKRATFVRAAASEELDPRLLRLGPLGFLPVSDARMRGTIAALEEEILGRADGPSSEPRAGFWLAENWILQGRVDEAQQLIEELLERRNDVGLLADGRTRLGRGTGHHFPALCCQVALVNSILRLEGAHQKARTQFETLQGPIRTPERTRQSAARNA
jgi:GH15 family glucan-1,4-alpha-glucosidase